MYLYWCPDWRSAGLDDISCGEGGGPSTPPAVARVCANMDDQLWGDVVSMTVLGNCRRDAGYTYQNEPSLDKAVLCSPSQVAELRGCLDWLGCSRPPICLPDGGTWGCDDLLASCPELVPQACYTGFNGRTFTSRMRIYECLVKQPREEGESCSNAFFRCAWGL